MKNILFVSWIVASLLFLFPSRQAYSDDLVVRPHVPMGHKLPVINPPNGKAPDPNDFPREEGKVSLQILFEMEKGLDFSIKQFLTAPQNPHMLWEDKSLTAEELKNAKIPIMGSLDTEEGMINGPVSLPPGQYFITLVVDNRKGTKDIKFFVPAPNPKSHILLSWDTSSIAMLNVVAKCLCASVVFTAPKGGLWYRVIGITIDKEIPLPSRMAFTMTAMKAPRALNHEPEIYGPLQVKTE